jgi:hypothetical protein
MCSITASCNNRTSTLKIVRASRINHRYYKYHRYRITDGLFSYFYYALWAWHAQKVILTFILGGLLQVVWSEGQKPLYKYNVHQ